MQTRERLLDVAGELLGEVGIERISTNMICARAGVTPPALYRYFKDKYAVLEALGRRLMDRQNAVLFAWLDRSRTERPDGARRAHRGSAARDGRRHGSRARRGLDAAGVARRAATRARAHRVASTW